MAFAGSVFNWVPVSGGIWTRIAQGPLVVGVPFEVLELVRMFPGPPVPVSFTLNGYSASPPFYTHETNVVSTEFLSPDPMGSTGNWALVLAYPVSPWVEFWLLADHDCFAHIASV